MKLADWNVENCNIKIEKLKTIKSRKKETSTLKLTSGNIKYTTEFLLGESWLPNVTNRASVFMLVS
jgi:hypothetical protein